MPTVLGDRSARKVLSGQGECGVTNEKARATFTASESAIFNAIRNGLVNGDKAARASGKTDCHGCVKGDAIDAYHDKSFMDAGTTRSGTEEISGPKAFGQTLFPTIRKTSLRMTRGAYLTDCL
jgi:hypothetical protein